MEGRCNVIKRILIPKLKKTIVYILSELEEREREETFRIKQFKKLKDRRKKKDIKDEDTVHICSCCLAMLEKDKENNIVCEKCRELENISEQIYTEPCSYEDNNVDEMKQRLELLKDHIAEVISLSKICTQDGLVSDSMEKFIKTCYAVKEKIEDDYGVLPVCEICMQKMQKSDRVEIPQSVTPKSVKSETTDEPTDSIYNLGSESGNKLGYFEKKFKEIVKVTRLKNDDGTVSEEKQVITIRTERRNPKKPGAGSCAGIDDDPYLGPGGYDGDSGKNFRFPRNAKSERTCQSNKMGEQKVRRCMSAGFQKPEEDASSNYNTSNCCTTKCSQFNFSRSDSHVCESRSGSKPATENNSLTSDSITRFNIPPCKSTSSTQTCCKEIPVQKPVQQCHPCCLTACHGDAVESKKSENGKAVCFSTGTDALWRDATTSTTELDVEPSRLPDFTQSTASVRTNCGTETKEPPQSTEKPIIKCRIKILPKASEADPDIICSSAPPVKEEKQNTNEEKQIVIRGSLLDILKSIILPRTQQTESNTTKVAFTEPDKPKLICKSCMSRLSSYVAKQDLDGPSVHSNSSSCKLCQASIWSKEDVNSGSTSALSPSLSCKSLGIGSSSSQMKYCQSSEKSKPPIKKSKCCDPLKKPPCYEDTPKSHVKPHRCCVAKDKTKDSEYPSCCSLAAKLLAKNSSNADHCIASKSPRTSTTSPRRSSSLQKAQSQSKCIDTKDATTCTKRSDKYDVRSIRHLPSMSRSKKSTDDICSCQSEPNLCGNRADNPYFRKSKSCCGNFNVNDYFKQ